MAIKEESVTEQKNSLAVCLDNILRHAGITRNTEYDLAQGKTATTILSENMTGVQVLDLSGCTLDAVLYYVNQDIPVLAILEDGEAVLVTGFNEFNVVIMEPATGKLYKKGMNDATAWFAENGKAPGTCERIRTPFWRDDRLFLYVKNVFAIFLKHGAKQHAQDAAGDHFPDAYGQHEIRNATL